MRIVIISDTHSLHDELGVLRGDVLIHCGDGLNGFTRSAGALDRLDDWFGRQQFDRMFCTGGNHDFELEDRVRANQPVLRNADYLQDESRHYRGVTFHGAPWTPELQAWTFYLPYDDMRTKWELIPDDTDVLITHTPPMGILDQNRHGRHCNTANPVPSPRRFLIAKNHSWRHVSDCPRYPNLAPKSVFGSACPS